MPPRTRKRAKAGGPVLRSEAGRQLHLLALCHGRKHQESNPVPYPENARWTFVDMDARSDPDHVGNGFDAQWLRRALPVQAQYDLVELRYCPAFAMEGWHTQRGAYRKFAPLCDLVPLVRRPDGVIHISRPVPDPRAGWARDRLLDAVGPHSTALGWVRGVERECGLRWIPNDTEEWRRLNARLGDALTDADGRPLGLTFSPRGVLTRHRRVRSPRSR